jgi:hypothetical protein
MDVRTGCTTWAQVQQKLTQIKQVYFVISCSQATVQQSTISWAHWDTVVVRARVVQEYIMNALEFYWPTAVACFIVLQAPTVKVLHEHQALPTPLPKTLGLSTDRRTSKRCTQSALAV